MLLNSFFVVFFFDMYMFRRYVFIFFRLILKIRIVSGFILSSALSLELFVVWENGDFCICVIKVFFEKELKRYCRVCLIL